MFGVVMYPSYNQFYCLHRRRQMTLFGGRSQVEKGRLAGVQHDPTVLAQQLGYDLLRVVEGHLDERVSALLTA